MDVSHLLYYEADDLVFDVEVFLERLSGSVLFDAFQLQGLRQYLFLRGVSAYREGRAQFAVNLDRQLHRIGDCEGLVIGGPLRFEDAFCVSRNLPQLFRYMRRERGEEYYKTLEAGPGYAFTRGGGDSIQEFHECAYSRVEFKALQALRDFVDKYIYLPCDNIIVPFANRVLYPACPVPRPPQEFIDALYPAVAPFGVELGRPDEQFIHPYRVRPVSRNEFIRVDDISLGL